jgi:hypothetical protein
MAPRLPSAYGSAMAMSRGVVAGVSLLLVCACSVPLKSGSKKHQSPATDTQPGDYAAAVEIVGPGVAVASGQQLGPCSSEDARFDVVVSGALELSGQTAEYGCSGTRSLEGDVINPTVSVTLDDGRVLDTTLFISDTELDQVDAPTSVKFWARGDSTFAYSRSWESDSCSTSYEQSDVDVSLEFRRIYRVAGVTICPEPLVASDPNRKDSDPTLSVERLDFVSDVVWFDRSLL